MAKNFRTGLIITGDSKGGVRAVRATSSELRRLNQDFETGSKRARTYGNETRETARELEFLKQNALGIGAALAGAFAANNLAQQAAMVRDTDALAQSLQVSTRTLQQWQFAGKQVGLEADKVGDIFKDVSDKVGDFAATGGGEAADLFENLNLNIRELQSLSPDQQILRIAEAINQVEDPSQRAFYFESLADEMVRLQPLLANGAQGLREAADMADALGVAMDDIEVRRAVEAAEAMDQLQGVAQGLSNTLIADLGPGLASNVRSLTEFIDQVGGADEVLESIGQTVTTLGSVYLAVRLRDPLSKIGPLGLAAGRNIATGFAMAVGASGRLNQALVITQGRIAATAAAGRALRASLALIGGPAGAALLAAGALYTYRDELGLTQDKIGLTEEQLASFRDELADMSQDDLGQSLTSLNAELDQATLKAARAREELASLRSESSGSGFLGFEGGEVGERIRGIRAVADAEADIAKIEQKRDAALAERGSRIYKPLTGWLFETKRATDSNTESITRQSQAAKEAARRAQQFTSSLASLEDRLFPVEAAQRSFREEQILLQTALLKGEMSMARYLEAWKRLQESMRSDQSPSDAYGQGAGVPGGIQGGFGGQIGQGGMGGQGTQDGSAWDRWLKSAETAFTDFDAMAANTAESFQRGFGSAFESMIFDSQNFGDAMHNLFDGIARTLVRSLGEMAAQWLAYQAIQMATQSMADSAQTEAVGKATATGSSIASAYAPAAAMASLASFGSNAAPASAAIIGTTALAQGMSFVGQGHDGIDSVPNSGTWNVEKGERITGAALNQDLTRFLDRENRAAAAAQGRGRNAQPYGGDVEFHIHNNGQPVQVESTRERQEGDKRIIDVVVSNVIGGGDIPKAMETRYPLKSQGWK
ncbi:hypothetical protein [Halomonas caseinilytica]|uniref:Uncharacterized protein n=1 Tax=Halomonas caseinilytica TaxID=438744 RepID=A0A1M6TB68_9GAMM|nr:hypothetical protein [Halomonas caseinilytica]SHK54076.1 hypothetical protein SAMN05192556_103273 [Halomonas caseinilytica]